MNLKGGSLTVIQIIAQTHLITRNEAVDNVATLLAVADIDVGHRAPFKTSLDIPHAPQEAFMDFPFKAARLYLLLRDLQAQ